MIFVAAHLKEPLADYIKSFNKNHSREVVKLFRNEERLGLIRTRTRGAELSTADVIVFLDAHCECNRNWLVPLLERIAYDRYCEFTTILEKVIWKVKRMLQSNAIQYEAPRGPETSKQRQKKEKASLDGLTISSFFPNQGDKSNTG